jgi:hypothetical protein
LVNFVSRNFHERHEKKKISQHLAKYIWNRLSFWDRLGSFYSHEPTPSNCKAPYFYGNQPDLNENKKKSGLVNHFSGTQYSQEKNENASEKKRRKQRVAELNGFISAKFQMERIASARRKETNLAAVPALF